MIFAVYEGRRRESMMTMIPIDSKSQDHGRSHEMLVFSSNLECFCFFFVKLLSKVGKDVCAETTTRSLAVFPVTQYETIVAFATHKVQPHSGSPATGYIHLPPVTNGFEPPIKGLPWCAFVLVSSPCPVQEVSRMFIHREKMRYKGCAPEFGFSAEKADRCTAWPPTHLVIHHPRLSLYHAS